MVARVVVLENPAKKDKSPKKRGRRGGGCVWQPKYKLADGTVRKAEFFWIRYTDDQGKRHNESTNFRHKKEAQEMLFDRLTKISRGEFEDFQKYRKVTLKQVCDLLRADYARQERRSTKKAERSLKRLETYFGEHCPAASITSEKIDQYLSARRKEKPVPSEPTLSRELAALKTAFNLALSKDMLRRVPSIVIPDERHRADEGEFSPEQFTALITQLEAKNRSKYLPSVVRFLYRTGMRAQEPMGMKWAEVRLDLRMLRLPARRTKGKEPKSITLDGDLLKLIEQQRKLHDKKFPSCEYVFPDAAGNQIGYDRALDQFQAACKRAGITEGFTTWDGQLRRPGFHDLRRTFAREADRCGVPHDEIMNIAGWKTHAMLLRYLGAPEDRMRSAFSKMDMSYGKARQTQAAD